MNIDMHDETEKTPNLLTGSTLNKRTRMYEKCTFNIFNLWRFEDKKISKSSFLLGGKNLMFRSQMQNLICSKKKANDKTSCVKFIFLQETQKQTKMRRWAGQTSYMYVISEVKSKTSYRVSQKEGYRNFES